MRLLILTQSVDTKDPILGFFHEWIVEISKHVESVIVVCLRKGTYELPSNVEVFSLGKEAGGNRVLYLVRFFTYIWKFRNRYDVVFIHMNQIYAICGGLFWKLWNKKVYLWYAHKQVSWSLQAGLFWVDRVFTPNKNSFRIESPKVYITGHGIDTDIFSPKKQQLPRDDFVVTTIGRISKVKRYDTIVTALSYIPHEHVVLHIIGGPATEEDKAYIEQIKNLVTDLGLDQRVVFQGSIPHTDIISHLQASDVFVNMSATGSLDKAVLEAMSVGVPVITSNEAFSEMLAPHGLFCEAEDAHSLAEKITRIQQDAHYRENLAHILRTEVVEHHNLQSLIGKIVDIIKTDMVHT